MAMDWSGYKNNRGIYNGMIWIVPMSILTVILNFISNILNALQWQWPMQIETALTTAVSVLHTFSQIIPWIGTIIAIYLIIAPTYVIKYLLKIILWGWGLLPFIGKQSEIPTLNLRPQHIDKNTLDLRQSKRSPRKTMRDIQKP